MKFYQYLIKTQQNKAQSMCIFLYTRNKNYLKKDDHSISNKWELHQSSIFEDVK